MTADRYDLTRHETLKTPGRRRNEWKAGGPPTVTDDESKEFEVGSRWLDPVAGALWTCFDSRVGGAVWRRGTGAAHHELAELGDDDHVIYGLVFSQSDPPPDPARDEALWIDTNDDSLHVWDASANVWLAVTAGYAALEHPHMAEDVWYEDAAADFPLPVSTATLRPDGDVDLSGVDAWSNSGSQAAWQQVDEAVLNTSDWLGVVSAGGKFSMTDFPGLATDYIRRIRVFGNAICGAPSSGGRVGLYDPVSGSESVAYAAWGQSSSGDRWSAWMDTCWWDGEPWTAARLALLQFFPRHAGPIGGTTVRQMYVEVEYDAGTTVQSVLEQVAGAFHPQEHTHPLTELDPIALDDLSDVEVDAVADGDVVRYSATGALAPHAVAFSAAGFNGVVDHCTDAGSAPVAAVSNAGYGTVAASGSDQNTSTKWTTAAGVNVPHWLQLDFGSGIDRKVSLSHWGIWVSDPTRPGTFTVEGSNDLSAWTELASHTGGVANTVWTTGVMPDPALGPFRYIRVLQPPYGNIIGGSQMTLGDVEFWGVVYGPDTVGMWVNVPLDPPVLDHGGLTGLPDDDHTRYGLMFAQASPPAAPARPEAIWIDTDGVPDTPGSLGGLSDVDVSGVDDGDSLIWDATGGEWVAAAPGALPLDGLTDVNAPAPADGDALVWDDAAGEWVAATPAAVPSTLDALSDVNAPAPAAGDVLTWDDTPGEWVSAAPTGGGGAGNVAGTWATADPGAPASPEALWYDTDAAAVAAPSVAEGTAFPVSPTSGMRFYRTNVRGGMWFRYDGTRWLSEQEYSWAPPAQQAITTDTNNFNMPLPTDYAIYLTRWHNVTYFGTAGGVYAATLALLDFANTATVIATRSTGATPAKFYHDTDVLGVVCDGRGGNVDGGKVGIQVFWDETAGASNFWGGTVVEYRLIAT